METQINGPIFYLCNDPERALGLEDLIKNFHIICIDSPPFIKLARMKGINIYSLAEAKKNVNPTYRSSSQLLKDKKVLKYINSNTPKGQKTHIMVFKISLEIEELCKKLNYKILNTTSALNKKFELKISQYNSLNNMSRSFPKTIISTLNKTTYSELNKKLGEKFVIQYNRGHTGNSTVFITNEKEYKEERIKFPNRLARIAQYIEGEIYTLNLCITRFGMLYGGLSYQITGMKGLTSKQGGTVGNDWLYPQKLLKKTQIQLQDIVNKIQDNMFKSGYRGLLGIDIVVTRTNKIYLLEINARQPASTSMHTKLMLNEEFIPLQAFHIAEFMFEKDKEYLLFLNKCFNKGLAERNIKKYIQEQNKLAMIPINAGQIIMRNTKKLKMKIQSHLAQGIYFHNQTFLKTNDGYTISDIIPKEYLIMTTKIGQIIKPENEIARIQTLENVVDERGNLTNEISELINKINKKVQMQ